MTDDEKSRVDRINQVSAMARTSWLALLGYLAFVGVTLLGVEDADFFVPTRQTRLPLVDVSIPTASFFAFAPILAAALYVYLHVHLLKLWDAIADAPTQIDGQPLGDHLHPWLVNDWALTRKGGHALPDRPLRALGNLASLALVWLAAPAVLFGFWIRSMPAHNEWLTLLLALCLLVALHAGVIGGLSARAWLATPRHEPDTTRWRRRDLWYLGTFLGCVTLLTTEFPFDVSAGPRFFSTLAPITLDGVEMVELPADWRTPETAEQAFRETWCRRHGLEMAVCDHLPSPDRPVTAAALVERARWCKEHPPQDASCESLFGGLDLLFEKSWDEERESVIANLPRVNLGGADLRRASATQVSLVGTDLSGARLEGATLRQARLEGASLRGAGLKGADLRGARLEGADLRGARLERALLWGARLEGADLTEARLEGADLFKARLERADLRGARLEGAGLVGARLERADLTKARLEGAELWAARLDGASLREADFRRSNWFGATSRDSPAQFADFRGARGLTQAQVEDLIGHDGTLLPEGPAPDTGQPYHVWTCWATPPPEIDRIVATAAGPDADDADRAALRAEFLCGPGNPRLEAGTPFAVDAPYPDWHPLADRAEDGVLR